VRLGAPKGARTASRPAIAGATAARPRTSGARPAAPSGSVAQRVALALDALRRKATRSTRDGLARYAIPATHAFGVKMGDIQAIAKRIGPDHALALALWDTGWYEARMLVAYVAEPQQLTVAQMDRWCRDFDNWATCDTLCFALFYRGAMAWGRIPAWAKRRDEFQRRAAFSLIASLALHDRGAADEAFRPHFGLIEAAAADERNFVKKGVSWALRGIAQRSEPLHAEALALARRLAESPHSPARWIGKDVLRRIDTPAVRARFVKRASAAR
jgi:3-methyladenine DNA glycosylase AlkD